MARYTRPREEVKGKDRAEIEAALQLVDDLALWWEWECAADMFPLECRRRHGMGIITTAHEDCGWLLVIRFPSKVAT